MGKAVIYYIVALAIILGLTSIALKTESCNQKSAVSIHANDLSADKADDITEADLDDDDDEPYDEENDATGKGSTTSDEDADDDEVIPIEGDEEEYNDEDDTEAIAAARSSSSSSSNSGDYLVIAGAYKQKANANAEVDRLQNSGYPNAEIVEFDFSDYYSVCVAKYDNRSDADAVANSIKSRSGKKAYVHKKRSKR